MKKQIQLKDIPEAMQEMAESSGAYFCKKLHA